MPVGGLALVRREHPVARELAFTLLAIMPVNKRLMAMLEHEPGPNSRAMLGQWGKLHNVRSELGATKMLLFTWALTSAG